ncbi:hypothetical protein TNCT_362881 [Trichonephila clavata]|uniref:Uncharacterized protein n=1 Tax=Trichonephila clavata TaxID=2740835 RepID=A0A8X6FB99_TRICU|nr:hypothetical protein TNCT_362881 [Trichonephila clavata]
MWLQIYSCVSININGDLISGQSMKMRSHSSTNDRSGDQKMLLIFACVSCIGIVAVSSFGIKTDITQLQEEEMIAEFWESNNSDNSKGKNSLIDRKSSEVSNKISSALEWFHDSMDEEISGASDSSPRFTKPFESSDESILGISSDQVSKLSNYNSKIDDDNKSKTMSKRDNSVMIPQIRARYGRSNYLIPASRLGKSNYSIPNSRFKRLDFPNPESRFKRYNYLIPIPRFGRSDALIAVPRIGRSNYLISAPRLGRSNYIIPVLRIGRSDLLIPAPRFGKSNYLIPVPRVGRSNYLIPVPRVGRANYLIPVPRVGRSNYLIPVPRFGRSNYLIPVPRVGRSNYLIPVHRVGRSNYLIPVPRIGRSNYLIPVPRVGRANYLIPVPRVGRLNYLIPVHRVGRSNYLFPVSRVGRSNYLIPVPRVGRSKYITPVQDRNMNEKILSSSTEEDNIKAGDSEGYHAYNFATKRISDSNGTIILYPRPGRTAETKSEEMKNELELVDLAVKRQTNDTLIPQIRYG